MPRVRGAPEGRYLIYGPPKSGKTLVALFLAWGEGKPVYVDLDFRRQLVTLSCLRLEPEEPGVRGAAAVLRRALRIADVLGAPIVVDSLLPVLEVLGPEGTRELVEPLSGHRGAVFLVSPWYLPMGYSAVKVVRSGDQIVASGPGLLLRVGMAELVDAVIMMDAESRRALHMKVVHAWGEGGAKVV
ncbi:MAG: hypothetical protein QXP81_09695 [Nitrososphaerota archaeon]